MARPRKEELDFTSKKTAAKNAPKAKRKYTRRATAKTTEATSLRDAYNRGVEHGQFIATL